MTGESILYLQNAYTDLKEVINYDHLKDQIDSEELSLFHKTKIEHAMRKIQLALQAQGVFIS